MSFISFFLSILVLKSRLSSLISSHMFSTGFLYCFTSLHLFNFLIYQLYYCFFFAFSLSFLAIPYFLFSPNLISSLFFFLFLVCLFCSSSFLFMLFSYIFLISFTFLMSFCCLFSISQFLILFIFVLFFCILSFFFVLFYWYIYFIYEYFRCKIPFVWDFPFKWAVLTSYENIIWLFFLSNAFTNWITDE